MVRQISRQMMAQVLGREADLVMLDEDVLTRFEENIQESRAAGLVDGCTLRQAHEHLAAEFDSPFLAVHIDFDRSS